MGIVVSFKDPDIKTNPWDNSRVRDCLRSALTVKVYLTFKIVFYKYPSGCLY
jgi:hypothetical protein